MKYFIVALLIFSLCGCNKRNEELIKYLDSRVKVEVIAQDQEKLIIDEEEFLRSLRKIFSNDYKILSYQKGTVNYYLSKDQVTQYIIGVHYGNQAISVRKTKAANGDEFNITITSPEVIEFCEKYFYLYLTPQPRQKKIMLPVTVR